LQEFSNRLKHKFSLTRTWLVSVVKQVYLSSFVSVLVSTSDTTLLSLGLWNFLNLDYGRIQQVLASYRASKESAEISRVSFNCHW